MPHPDAQPVRHPAAARADPPVRPPPLYFPGEAECARRAEPAAGAAGGGAVRSTNVASSRAAKVGWAVHPAIDGGWRRWMRPRVWWRCLGKGEKEELWGGWPVEFGGVRREAGVGRGRGRGREDEESGMSRTQSGRSTGADSG